MTLIGLTVEPMICRRPASNSRSRDRSRRSPRERRWTGSPAAAAAAHPDSALGRLVAAATAGARAPTRSRRRSDGDQPAVAAVRRWAHALGVGIANAINTFDPDEVVIGGGAALAAGRLLLDPAIEFAAGYVHPGLRERINVRAARWGTTAGVLGAGLLAVHELEREDVLNA